MSPSVENVIEGKQGLWKSIHGHFAFVDKNNIVLYPSYLADIEISSLNKSSFKEVNIDKNQLHLVKLLLIGNTENYKPLGNQLENIFHLFQLGTEFETTQNQVKKLENFLKSYSPLDLNKKMYLASYYNRYKDSIHTLLSYINQDIQNRKNKEKEDAKAFFLKFKKNKYSNFGFLDGEKLVLKNVESLKTVKTDWNINGLHQKMYVQYEDDIYLVDGYEDDAYSCVNRVLVSQIAKLLELNCEEVYFSKYHDKPVNLSLIKPMVSLMENWTYEFYVLDIKKYVYQSQQKRALYFLVQNTNAYISNGKKWKERFSEHFIDTFGQVFLSNNSKALFMTPKELGINVLTLEIKNENYKAMKDLVKKMKKEDIADIVFSSIPIEFVELHDEYAKKNNKPTFYEKKISFDKNWHNLLLSIDEFKTGMN